MMFQPEQNASSCRWCLSAASKVSLLFFLVLLVSWENVMISHRLVRMASQSDHVAVQAEQGQSKVLRRLSAKKEHKQDPDDAPTEDPYSNPTVTTSPFMTFVIPSSLTRDTLARTLQSLQNQTNGDWEAVVGVDMIVLNKNAKTDNMGSSFRPQDWDQFVRDRFLNSLHYTTNTTDAILRDPRIRFVPIRTSSKDRGKKQNGAGQVRNLMIRQHVSLGSQWVAFVDDDDTLTPNYVQELKQQSSSSQAEPMDVLVFRMVILDNSTAIHSKKKRIIPKPHQHVLMKNDVGISFALRRSLFLTSLQQQELNVAHGNHSSLAFQADSAEDFMLLQSAWDAGYNIHVSSCIGYCVKGAPGQLQHATKFTREYYQSFLQNCSASKAVVSEELFVPEALPSSVVVVDYASGSTNRARRRATTVVTVAKKK
ncbi:expressed unknown protein [Seminavis robusta]|uniref:Uncharacterized protein n=1 Tax=Seminavis robusta TaxID=568900 RepID=A0A9N8DFW6_9STRA|nr:expressed unknown protein [Seminavis robusta]|eukprot:Sro131_g062200.1 n/a (424) ;mRNA; r:34004-35275